MGCRALAVADTDCRRRWACGLSVRADGPETRLEINTPPTRDPIRLRFRPMD